MSILIVIVGVAAFFWWQKEHRRKQLMEKYRDEVIVKRIMRGEFWEGQTVEQLIDSLGQPRQRDSTVYKTKSKDTWKYKRMGRGQYRLRVFVEDNIVVGWKNNAR